MKALCRPRKKVQQPEIFSQIVDVLGALPSRGNAASLLLVPADDDGWAAQGAASSRLGCSAGGTATIATAGGAEASGSSALPVRRPKLLPIARGRRPGRGQIVFFAECRPT